MQRRGVYQGKPLECLGLADELSIQGDGNAGEGARNRAAFFGLLGEFVKLFLGDTGNFGFHIEGDASDNRPLIIPTEVYEGSRRDAFRWELRGS